MGETVENSGGSDFGGVTTPNSKLWEKWSAGYTLNKNTI